MLQGNEVSPLENLAENMNRSLRKENNNILEDQTMWVEKQHELLTLIQRKRDIEVDIKHHNQDIIVLSGKRRKLDCEWMTLSP